MNFCFGGGGMVKLDYFWKLFLNIQGLFLRSRYRIGIFFGVANFQLFLGVHCMPNTSDIYFF